MRRASLLVGVFVVVIWTAVPAEASIFSQGLTYDGVTDYIQDNSVSLAIVDSGPLGVADGVVSVNDVIAGLIIWNQNNVSGESFGRYAIGVFAAKVVTGPTPTARTVTYQGVNYPELGFTLEAALNGSGNSLLNDLLPNQAATIPGGFNSKTLGVILSGASAINPTSLPFQVAGPNNDALDLLDNAPYAIDITVGIDNSFAGKNKWGSTDYFQATLADATGDGVISITPIAGPPNNRIAEYSTIPNPWQVAQKIGSEAAMFTVIHSNIGPFLSVTEFDLYSATPLTGDFAITNDTFLKIGTDSQRANGYQFGDQSNASLNPIPEPVSSVIWLFGALMAGIYCWRKR